MRETLRQVAANLWVSDLESAAEVGGDFTVVLDCTGKTTGRNVLESRPTGSTNHTWTVEDLDTLTDRAGRILEGQGTVLIHCRRGVSRSACAAAAVLLAQGKASSVKDALARTAIPGSPPASQSVSGLQKWWAAQNQMSLFG